MQEECRGWGRFKIKTLIQAKRYPVQIKSASTSGSSVDLNLNNINWYALNDRIEIEDPISRSALFLKFPPAGDDTTAYYRRYEIKYACNTAISIPAFPDLKTRNVEDYMGTPLTGTINRTSDADVGFPLDTFKAIDDCTNPSNITAFMWITCNVAPYVARGSAFWGQQYAEFLLNPIWKKPTIFNIAINSTDIRNNIEVTWTASPQDFAEIEVWQNDVLKRVIPVGTERRAVIPGGTVGIGNFTVKVVAANNPIEDLGTTNSASASFTGTSIVPTGKSLAVLQEEPRLPITFTWESTNQTDYKAEIVQNGVVKAILTGGAINSGQIPLNTLTEGEYSINLSINNTLNGISTTVIISGNFIAKIGKPIITSLEPDGINQNVDLQINVSWVCSNQDTYVLKAYQENILVKTYSGNTQKSLVIPAGTFKSGNIKLEITCTNTINGVAAVATRIATFLGYGKPQIPILDSQIIYSKAKPTFKWTSAEQTSYIFEIWKDNIKIEGTSEVIGTSKSYTTEAALENNSTFIVKVKVKNQFNLWSDFATKEITVSYTELPKPEFDIVRDGSGILITMMMEENPDLASLEIWRKDAYSKWVRLAYDMKRTDQWTDNTVASGKEYFYKVIANALNGGMSESDIKSERANINDFVFVDIEDTTNKAILRWNPKVSISNRRKISSKIYAGCSKPKIEKGKVKYKVASMEFTVKKPELEYLQYLADNSKVLLFRDRRGEKIYGQISSDIGETYEMMDRVSINFEFTELNFIEKDIHKGSGGIVLTFHNGKWKFDGTITYSGYGVL